MEYICQMKTFLESQTEEDKHRYYKIMQFICDNGGDCLYVRYDDDTHDLAYMLRFKDDTHIIIPDIDFYMKKSRSSMRKMYQIIKY